MAYGTLTTLDTLHASDLTIYEYGEDKAFENINRDLVAHNNIVNGMIMNFIERTTDRIRGYGSNASMVMDEVDEMAQADAQKITAGQNVGFPLRLFQETVQWNRKFIENETMGELVAQFEAAKVAHVTQIQKQIKRAIFTPTNSTLSDRYVKPIIDLPLKAFVNADSADVPISPNGQTFDGTTHTHFLARAGGSVAASDVSALVEAVLEHHNQGGAMLYINRAQEAAIRAMTANFVPYFDTRTNPAIDSTTGIGGLDVNNLYNRAIGLFDGAEVWVKPWIPASYMFAFVMGAPKPLVMRERRPGSGMLKLVSDDERYPLRAQTLEAEFGIGVWNRTNGAVLYTGDTSYATPTF